MKLTLTIEASAAVIASVLAALPQDGVQVVQNVTTSPTAVPVQPAATPFIPAMPTTSDDDDDGDEGTPSDAATDSNNLPWDERIHAGTKTQTAKGAWKKRKGVSDEVVAAVEAELRAAAMNVPQQPIAMPVAMGAAPTPVPTAAPLPMSMPTPVNEAAPTMPTPAPAATPSPVPMMPTAAQPEHASGEIAFPQFMVKIGELMKNNTLTTDNLIWLCQQLGVQAITDVGALPEKMTEAVALLRQYNMWAD